MFKILRLLLPLFIIVFVLPMVVPGPSGKPVMTPKDWLPDQSTLNNASHFFKTAVNKVAAVFGQEAILEAGVAGSSTDAWGSQKNFYKWQDEQGQWHFSDNSGHAAGHNVSQQKLPQVSNRLPPVEIPAVDDKKPASKAAGDEPPAWQFSPTSIPLDEIPKLIEDTKKIRAQLEQRNKEIEKI